MIKHTQKEKCKICNKNAHIMFINKSGKQKYYYCNLCYEDGKWIERQGLFREWKFVRL
mgnify:CR=1 FL=1